MSKTLLIDNGSTLTKKLAELSPYQEDIVPYTEIPHDLSPYSLILLSGSSQFPVQGNEQKLQKEFELVLNTNIPVVGICLGHEIIAQAYDCDLLELKEQHQGMTDVAVVIEDDIFLGKKTFQVYENHRYGITETSEHMTALAVTDHSISIIKHKTKKIYGFQFHPEHHTDKQFGDEVFLKLFSLLTK